MPQTDALTQLKHAYWDALVKEPDPKMHERLTHVERIERAAILVQSGEIKGKSKCKFCHGKGYILRKAPKQKEFKPMACDCAIGQLRLLITAEQYKKALKYEQAKSPKGTGPEDDSESAEPKPKVKRKPKAQGKTKDTTSPVGRAEQTEEPKPKTKTPRKKRTTNKSKPAEGKGTKE